MKKISVQNTVKMLDELGATEVQKELILNNVSQYNKMLGDFQKGVKINFTLEFSARQNVLVAAITKPNYQNVFLGRIGAYISDNGLGDGSGAGERAVLASQKWVTELTKNNPVPTRLIAASLRNYGQLEDLAAWMYLPCPPTWPPKGRRSFPVISAPGS